MFGDRSAKHDELVKKAVCELSQKVDVIAFCTNIHVTN